MTTTNQLAPKVNRKAYPLHIPKKLQKAINKCLKPNPGDRFGSAIEVVNEFADIDGSILHWEFKPTDNELVWEQNIDGVLKNITIQHNKTSRAYTQKGDSKSRKVTEFCKENISNEEIIRFLEQ